MAQQNRIGDVIALLAGLVLAVAVAGPALTQSNDNFDRRVQIINETGVAIVVFNASHVNTEDWEENILGDRTIRNGETVTINIDDGTGHCRYDFRAIFADGDIVVDEGVNVCEIGSHRYFVGN